MVVVVKGEAKQKVREGEIIESDIDPQYFLKNRFIVSTRQKKETAAEKAAREKAEADEAARIDAEKKEQEDKSNSDAEAAEKAAENGVSVTTENDGKDEITITTQTEQK